MGSSGTGALQGHLPPLSTSCSCPVVWLSPARPLPQGPGVKLGSRSRWLLCPAQNYPVFDLSTADPGGKGRLSTPLASREQADAAQHARCPPAAHRLLLTAVLVPREGWSHFFFSSCPFLPAQCLLLLAFLLILASPGRFVHTQSLNILKKSPSSAP